jgi:hypothetical protein
MGLHICHVANKATEPRGEYVEVVNDGATSSPLTGNELTDYTATQQHAHIYRFPAQPSGEPISLNPGQSAFVFSGYGEDALDENGNWLLFANRKAAVWNDDGDVAYLRHSNGELIDSLTVGHPKRHPNGH